MGSARPPLPTRLVRYADRWTQPERRWVRDQVQGVRLRRWRHRPYDRGRDLGQQHLWSACYAPLTSMYFDQLGQVRACCQNTGHLLGDVTQSSLREIWDGGSVRQLRGALREGDFGLGCDFCSWQVNEASVEGSFARWYDELPATRAQPRWPVQLEFAVTNTCNLQCVMCNGGLSSAIRRHREGRPPMAPAYDDAFFEELQDFLPHLHRAQFKGGEPFLCPENWRIWDELLRTGDRPELCVTTNGTVWSRSVERYVRELSMDVMISVDAVDPATLEAIRVGVDARRLWANVDRFQATVEATGQKLVLSFCLMAQTWAELGAFLTEAHRRGVEPHVIWVDGPANFNLLTMPKPELQTALGQLEAESRRWTRLGPVGQHIWDDALERIRRALDVQAGHEAPIAMPARRRAADGERRLRALRDELGRTSGTELLELEYRNDVVCSVVAPSWAGWLRPSDWLGTGLEQTMTMLSVSAGETMRSEIVAMEGGVHEVTLSFAGVLDQRLRGFYIPHSMGKATSLLLLGRVDAGLSGPLPVSDHLGSLRGSDGAVGQVVRRA